MSTTSRSVYRDTITVTRYPDGVLLPAAGAHVRFYEPDGATPTPLSVPLYASADSVTPLTLPLVTGALGEVEVWSDEAAGLRARQVVQYRDRPISDEVVDFEPPPGTYASRVYVDAVMDAHEAAPDPHQQYLTEPEGNLLYLPLSWAQQADPLAQYQRESERGQPSGYVPLDPNGLIPTVHLPPLAITDTFVVANEAEMLTLDAQTGDVAIQTDTELTFILADEPASVLANWKELSAAAPVLSVNGYVGVVNLTAADVGALTQTQADLRYLPFTGGALTGPLSIQGKPVAVSPDPGNILSWLPNGLFASLTTANVTVVRRQEFAPAGAATTVTLSSAPTTVLEVSRNGVAQSSALGHYTVAGAVVTFADSFVAGEHVLVLYEVGVSQPVDSYSKAEADARYEPIDTMYTKEEGDARYSFASHAHTGAYLPLTGGTLSGALVVQPAFGVTDGVTIRLYGTGSSYPNALRVWPQAGSTFPRFRISGVGELFWDNGTAGTDPLSIFRWDDTSIGVKGHLLAQAVGTYDLGTDNRRWRDLNLTGGVKWGASTAAADTTLTRTAAGALRVDNHLGVGANVPAWASTYRAVSIGERGALRAVASGSDIGLIDNSYNNGTDNRAIVAGAASLLSTGAGNLFFYNAPSVAAGATQAFAQRLYVNPTGTLALTPDTGQPALTAMGNLGVGEAASTTWNWGIRNVRLGHLGVVMANAEGAVDPASTTMAIMHNGQYLAGGIAPIENGRVTLAQVGQNGYFRVYNSAVGTAGTVISMVERLSMDVNGTFVFGPAAGSPCIITPNGSDALIFGYGRIRSVGATPYIDGQPGGYLMIGGGNNTGNALSVAPATHNATHLGWGDRGFALVHSVGGLVQDSTAAVKENVRDLAAEDALAAVRAVRIVRYDYRRVGDPATNQDNPLRRNHIGFIAEEAPGLLTLDNDLSVSPQSTASVALAAIKALAAEVADLKARLA